jgi:NADH:ubiquinone oxidoreductase subunit E
MVTTGATQEVRQLISEFSSERLYVLAALHKVQHHYGYIPQFAIPVVATHFGMATATLFGVISFYAEFRLAPLPETYVWWCSGPACRLKGGERIREIFERELGIGMEQSTVDGRVGLHLGQCNGTCVHAPQVWVNGKVVGQLTIADSIRLARSLRGGAAQAGETAAEAVESQGT